MKNGREQDARDTMKNVREQDARDTMRYLCYYITKQYLKGGKKL